jgi:hypothetical protein
LKILNYKNVKQEIKRVQVDEKEIIELKKLLENVDEINKIRYSEKSNKSTIKNTHTKSNPSGKQYEKLSKKINN